MHGKGWGARVLCQAFFAERCKDNSFTFKASQEAVLVLGARGCRFQEPQMLLDRTFAHAPPLGC